MAEQTITIPDNMELVKVSETEYKVVEKKKKLPKTWDEFCRSHSLKTGESWVSSCSTIESINDSALSKRTVTWFNLLPNKEYAEAILALCQLIQLRDCYRQGWKPDWKDNICKYSIEFVGDDLFKNVRTSVSMILTFKTEELRDEFSNNFKDLIKKIEPLFG